MFGWIKWILGLMVLLIFAGFLHYTLPQRDIVRVTGTEIVYKTITGWRTLFYAQNDSGEATTELRDTRLINAIKRNGRPMVYRNEDTGVIGWPPYFKFNSSDLQAVAQDSIETGDQERWFVVRHYGWRSRVFTLYPNAISIKPIENPDQRLIPWFNIAVLLVIFAIFWAIFVRIRRFWNNRIEPRMEQLDASVDETRERVGGWFKRD